MSATLPHGLITIGHANVSNNSNLHYADIVYDRMQVLHAFWKVHAVRYRVSKDSSDFRCQNLFWRTWTDPRLSKTIKTSTLTSLWTSCQQRIDNQSLRKSICGHTSSQRNRNLTNPATQLQYSSPSNDSTDELSPTSISLSRTHSTSRSTAARKLQEVRLDSDRSIDSRRPSKSARPGLTRVGSSNTRTSFSATPGRGKGRPTMIRRKSSQSAAQTKPVKLNKLVTKSPTLPSTDNEKFDVPPSAATASASTFRLPSTSSWEDEPALDHNRLSTSTSYSGTPSDLVEPNFRNRFAERIASSSNVAAMNKMRKTGSVVRFADEIPSELRKSNDTDYGSFVDPQYRAPLFHRGSTASIASVAVIDEDNLPSPRLPRTKSQLSMMIEETRSQHGRESFESLPSTNNTNLSSRRRREPTEEEKVLAMAHKEGVTKAGGRQIRRGFKINDEDESRYSSPSPPPLY